MGTIVKWRMAAIFCLYGFSGYCATSGAASADTLLKRKDKPRVMVLIQENNVGHEGPTNRTAETVILKFLRDPYQFGQVDQTIVDSVRSSRQQMAKLMGDNITAAAIGEKCGADVIIIGTAVSGEAMSPSTDKRVSLQATVTLKAINCSTSTVMGTAQAGAVTVHVNQLTGGTITLTQAAQKAIEKLIDSIMKAWSGRENIGITLCIVVKDVKTFRMKNDIIVSLQSLSGVIDVRENNWNAKTRALTVDVQYKGGINAFSRRVEGYKMRSGGGSMSVSSVKGSTISLIVRAM